MTAKSECRDEVWKKYFDVPEDRIVFMNDELVAFHDRRPRAATHLLVVPRYRYIKGVETLQTSDKDLLQAMARVGSEIANSDTEHMGFHQWPLRSVNHLHLHCTVPPYKRAWNKFQYSSTGNGSSHIGYIGVTAVLQRLSSS